MIKGNLRLRKMMSIANYKNQLPQNRTPKINWFYQKSRVAPATMEVARPNRKREIAVVTVRTEETRKARAVANEPP